MQNAIDQVQFLGDAFAVFAEHGESPVAGGARRIGSRDHVLVDVVLLVVGEGECDFALYEHSGEPVVRTLYEFFDHDVVLACAVAGVFVSFAGFVGVCGAMNPLAAGQVDWLHNNRKRELHDG